jgi:hypothetical protein
VEFLDAGSTGTTLRELYCYRPEWRHPSPETREAIVETGIPLLVRIELASKSLATLIGMPVQRQQPVV